MKVKKLRLMMLVLAVSAIIMLLTACQNKEGSVIDESPNAATEQTGGSEQPATQTDPGKVDDKQTTGEGNLAFPTEPVELVVYSRSTGNTKEQFMENTGNKIIAKYPNISLQFLSDTDITVEQLVVSNTSIDIYYGSYAGYFALRNAGYTNYDMTDLIKKYDFDLTRVNPELLESMKVINNGILNALPTSNLTTVMSYNKDIFDKFNVPYPTDGMTYDELYDLISQVTRTDNGVQYYGFGFLLLPNLLAANQYGENMIDPNTGKAVVDQGKWPEIFRVYSRLFEIPGNKYMTNPDVRKAFLVDKNLAMMANVSSQFTVESIFEGVNVDVVQLPSFADAPGVGMGPFPFFWGISSTSKHKDAAFAVLDFIMSDEQQTEGVARGGLPGIDFSGSEFEKKFHSAPESAWMKSKNIQGLIPEKYASPGLNEFNGRLMQGLVVQAFESVVMNNKDINTALREANEKIDQAIEAEKEKMKK